MATVTTFTGEGLLTIVEHVRGLLAAGAPALSLHVLDPDRGGGRYAGEPVEIDGTLYIHRPFRVWVELADRLGLRLLTPRPATAPCIELRFERLDPTARWQDAATDVTERYGAASGFESMSRISARSSFSVFTGKRTSDASVE